MPVIWVIWPLEWLVVIISRPQNQLLLKLESLDMMSKRKITLLWRPKISELSSVVLFKKVMKLLVELFTKLRTKKLSRKLHKIWESLLAQVPKINIFLLSDFKVCKNQELLPLLEKESTMCSPLRWQMLVLLWEMDAPLPKRRLTWFWQIMISRQVWELSCGVETFTIT